MGYKTVGLMNIPKIVVNARPVTTIVLRSAVTTRGRPHSACSGTETIPVPTTFRPASALSSVTISDSIVDMTDSDTTQRDGSNTDLQDTDKITPEVANVAAAQPDEAESMDVETVTAEVTRAIPDVTITCTESLEGQTDFLDALAHLDASTGNVPVATDYENIELEEAFNKEDSPELVEI